MDHTAARATGAKKRAHQLPAPVLFNDVYFKSKAPREGTTWFCFPNLPAELRQHIWLLHLQQYRLVEVEIWVGPEAWPPGPDHRYTERNHLGRVVSGPTYMFAVPGGRDSYLGSLSPLLRVNREARDVALAFYHIRLPFPGREQVLYLNSALDVVQIQPDKESSYSFDPFGMDTWERFSAPLVDFFHDARAYDVKDQGIAHLMLPRAMQLTLLAFNVAPLLRATPQYPAPIHPTAAASFADILRHKLRSLFLTLNSFETSRAQRSSYVLPQAQQRCHFAQTLPLGRAGHAAGAFRWLDADPRPGVELDISKVWTTDNPATLAQAWGQLERGFGITEADRAAREQAAHGGLELHFCLVQRWHFPQNEVEDVWSREALARRFQYDVSHWYAFTKGGRGEGNGPDERLQAYHGSKGQMDQGPPEGAGAEMSVPRDAIGMWIVPGQALKVPEEQPHDVFTLLQVTCGTRPRLLLFEVS